MFRLKTIGSHLIALILGVVLSFGTIKVLSSQAEPILEPQTTVDVPQTTIAQNDETESTVTNPQRFVGQAIAKTGPAVVRLDTERTVTRRIAPNDPFFSPFFDDPRFRDYFDNMTPQERQVRGQGSGFIIDSNGIILTNAHVVQGADRVTVTLKDGREFEGMVQGTDEVTDLAVIKINGGENLPVATLGDSDAVQVGDWAIAVGNPIGLNNTVTLGIISTLSRPSFQAGIPDKRIDFLQTDAAINPGNSGGPLLNDRGEVIGINTAIRADATGIGFAIPINKAKELKDILAAGKEVPHPFVGIQMVTLDPQLARENNSNPNSPFFVPEVEGVLVIQVLPDTPAEAAGIRRGDVIVEIDGQEVESASQLQAIVERSGVGSRLPIKLIRGDRNLQLSVTTAQLENFN